MKCATVALIGNTNAGKSTLLNGIMGEKISIISHKVQTTRNRLVGIHTTKDTQLIFIDTPGVFKARKAFDKHMVDLAWQEAGTADMALMLIDSASGITETVDYLLKKLKKPSIIMINKIDLIKNKDGLLALCDQLTKYPHVSDILFVSALKGDGVPELERYLIDNAPEGPWHYPDDQLTDMPERFFAAELTREKIFHCLHQEIPYATHVETESWEEKSTAVTLHQCIYVERASQKGMVVGKGARTIKLIREQSQHDLAQVIGKKVHLFLHVRVQENWKDRVLKGGLGAL
jgi:GTP-binding protein Era